MFFLNYMFQVKVRELHEYRELDPKNAQRITNNYLSLIFLLFISSLQGPHQGVYTKDFQVSQIVSKFCVSGVKIQCRLMTNLMHSFLMYLFMSLHVSSSKCSSSGGPNCINTSSGITHSGEWLSDVPVKRKQFPLDRHATLTRLCYITCCFNTIWPSWWWALAVRNM
jgi:hypothetical protein